MSFVDENKQKPFFLMWTTPLPHVSLQAPENGFNIMSRSLAMKNLIREKPDTGYAAIPMPLMRP